MSGVRAFSFDTQAKTFDRHIKSSIRGYASLRHDCKLLSQYFIQPKTHVIDIGCSTGEFVESVYNYNSPRVKDVRYLGVDINAEMAKCWVKRRKRNLRFRKVDIRTSDCLKNTSVVFSLFTLQFMPESDRLPLVRRIYDGLRDGGVFILSEKVHAKNAKIQDMLTFMYYDFKRLNHSEREILNKERALRDMMHPWSEYKLFEMLRAAGFASANTQLFWRQHSFIGILAWKQASYR